jgi:Protein of unknown function (DUF3147)
MIVRVKWEALRQGRWYEYIIRTILGGAATVVAGLIADHYGPTTGGLFLAFPAIFFASATLIEKHERQQKEEKGLQGGLRAKGAVALDAAGAGWGSIGLAGFAFVVWIAADKSPIGSLVLASLVWLASGIILWRLRRELRGP